MDPKAALDLAESYLDDGDDQAARQSLCDYRYWRRTGGFQPEGGDDRHDALQKRRGSRIRFAKEVPSHTTLASDVDVALEALKPSMKIRGSE